MKPRRPAQLEPEQIEAIEGEADVAYNSELAHASAQALYATGTHHLPDDPAVVARVRKLVEQEGIDVLAESWVRSPEDTLPGIFWRGYLLREWIRRNGDDVVERYNTACAHAREMGKNGETVIAITPKPGTVRQEWDLVFSGAFEGEIADVLTDSARVAFFLAAPGPNWIDSENDPLATRVTLRDKALFLTAQEFRNAAKLAFEGRLE